MDFITEWMEATETLPSPREFRLWAGISLVAASAQRRVWVRTKQYLTYPNLFIWLVASPGIGKQGISKARELAQSLVVKKNGHSHCELKLAPNSVTKASLIDALVASKSSFIPPGLPPVEYHSLYVVAEEIQLFMPQYDSEFLGVLNTLFNNEREFTETRRTGSVREVNAVAPQLNFLAGVQPGWMAGTLPELAWSTGLTARLIMVYVEDQPFYDFFGEEEDQADELNPVLREALIKLSRRYGEMTWAPEARAAAQAWDRGGQEPKPVHSKLDNYCKRRAMHVTKLALVSALSRGSDEKIQLIDFERAKTWLLEAEARMPDIFRAMAGKNDRAVIEELHHFMTNMWKINQGKPVHETRIFAFLTEHIPNEKIEKLVQVAVRGGFISRVEGTDFYLPRPKHQHGTGP